MDEMEKLEEELVIVYDLYVTRLRCLAFLERQQEEIEKAELEKMEVTSNMSINVGICII